MSTLFILLFLVTLFLLPIALLKPSFFKSSPNRKPWTKKQLGIGITIIALFFLVLALISSPATDGNKKQKQSTTKNETSSTEKPVEQFNIVVTSQMVKKIDSKYRYFFDIRNKDMKPFEGKVSITLYNEQQTNPLSGDTFTTNKPIEPNLGTSVYLDANTGPVSQHGEFGITKFQYVVKVNDQQVKEGNGQISDQFENLSSF